MWVMKDYKYVRFVVKLTFPEHHLWGKEFRVVHILTFYSRYLQTQYTITVARVEQYFSNVANNIDLTVSISTWHLFFSFPKVLVRDDIDDTYLGSLAHQFDGDFIVHVLNVSRHFLLMQPGERECRAASTSPGKGASKHCVSRTSTSCFSLGSIGQVSM